MTSAARASGAASDGEPHATTEGTAPPALSGTDAPLAKLFDVALLDLDGVVYRGQAPVEHAAEALKSAREGGMRLAFVTNNALRPPDEVARRISAAGVPAQASDVSTSAQAAARVLAERLAPGSRVLVAGGEGLRQAVAERAMVAVSRADEEPLAVVSGYDPELTYGRLAEAVVAIFGGAFWVASNTDATVPTERGLLPGAGAIVAFIATATKMRPQVAGKPERALHEEATSRSNARRPLVVGDRLDTDIEGANGVGAASLLVLTGVSTLADLLQAPASQRPTYLGTDLRALSRSAPETTTSETSARCGAWTCTYSGGRLSWQSSGNAGGSTATNSRDITSGADDDGLDAYRAGAALLWRLREAGESPHGVSGELPPQCEAFKE